MIIYLIVFLCATSEGDRSCSGYVSNSWEGAYALTSCQLSLEPTLDKLRPLRKEHVEAVCSQEVPSV